MRWFFLETLGQWLYRLWMRTARVTVIGEAGYLRLRAAGKPVIIIVWHGRILFSLYFFRHRDVMPLVSPSEDGEIVVRLTSGLGYKFMRGSGSHSMIRPWAGLIRELKRGGQVAIIPDGPKGPRRVMKPGALKLAQATGAAVVPFSFSTPRKKFLNSWDRFLLLYPFQRVVVAFGEPRTVPEDLSEGEFERERALLERRLIALDSRADEYFQRSG
jgi:lysophospholipid acyltransferase (LPLAT)-like uncharacterized protein